MTLTLYKRTKMENIPKSLKKTFWYAPYSIPKRNIPKKSRNHFGMFILVRFLPKPAYFFFNKNVFFGMFRIWYEKTYQNGSIPNLLFWIRNDLTTTSSLLPKCLQIHIHRFHPHQLYLILYLYYISIIIFQILKILNR